MAFASADYLTVLKPNGGEYLSGTYQVDYLLYIADQTYPQDILDPILSLYLTELTDLNGVIGYKDHLIERLSKSEIICDGNFYSEIIACHYDWNTLAPVFNMPSGNDGNFFLKARFDSDNSADISDNEFTIDNSNPMTNLEISGWQKNDFNVLFSCYDTGTGCAFTYYQIPAIDSNWMTIGSGEYIAIDSDGNYIVNFYSKDNAGNIEAMQSGFLLLDKNSPIAPVLNLPIGFDINFGLNPVALEWSGAGDGLSGINNYLIWKKQSDSNSWTYLGETPDSNYFDYAIISDLNYCYIVEAFDLAGNDSNSTESCVMIDSTVPVMTSLNASVNGSSVTLTYLATDENSSGIKNYFIQNGTNGWISTTEISYVFDGLANGTYLFYAKSIDHAGHDSNALLAEATVNVVPTGGGSPPASTGALASANPVGGSAPLANNSQNQPVENGSLITHPKVRISNPTKPNKLNATPDTNTKENLVINSGHVEASAEEPIKSTSLFQFGQSESIISIVIIILLSILILYLAEVRRRRKESAIDDHLQIKEHKFGKWSA